MATRGSRAARPEVLEDDELQQLISEKIDEDPAFWTGSGKRRPTINVEVEDGFVTAGFASVAAPVFDHGERPIAAITLTFRHLCDTPCGQTWPELAKEVRKAADELTVRIGGHAAST